MSNEEAAHVTQLAAQAADALTRVAADAATAVVEVAAAAHANMAPSVLVVSMFETLQHQIQQVAGRLDEGNKWMARADERHRKLVDGIGELNNKVAIQNGGVKSALNWIEAHDDRMESVAIMAQGRKMQRDADLAVVRGLRSFFKEWWPLVAGAVLGGIGVGSFLWGTIGGPPW